MSEETTPPNPEDSEPDPAPENVAQAQPTEPEFPENELLFETCNAEICEELYILENEEPAQDGTEETKADS